MICVHARQSELEKMGASALSKLVIAQMSRIEHLELQLAKMRRTQFGPKSEKAPVNAGQLTLGLNATVIEVQPVAQTEQPQSSNSKPSRPPRKSRALPGHLRREVRTHAPEHTNCPCCKGELRKLGEDVSEMLEYMPASFFVIRHVRPKMSCRKCSCVVQAPAPQRVIDRGLPGPGLLAHVIDDGRIEVDNMIAERALRPVAIGRRNYLFAGSDQGGRRAAVLYSLIGTARLNGLDPGGLPALRAGSHRRASRQADRGVAAMEHRRKARPRTTASRIDLPEEQQASPFLISSYPNIDEFTEHGQIVIGYMEPVGAVAIAAEGRETLALLRRRKNESFRQLLMRLDLAIASATIDDIYIDEVNTSKS